MKVLKKLTLSKETVRPLSGADLRYAIGGVGGLFPKQSDKGDCDTHATSGNPGSCKSALVSDCGGCD
jgi:hypothetical protein